MTTPHPTHRPAPRPAQQGLSLVVVLMILLVVSVIGIGAARISLSGERSSRFDRDYQLAFQAAEAALMDAEFDIYGPNTAAAQRMATFSNSNASDFLPGCGTGTIQGLCQPTNPLRPVWFEVDFLATGNNARSVEFGTFTGRNFDNALSGTGSAGARPSRSPRYIIEVLDDKGPGTGPRSRADELVPKIYRVTAMGFGTRDEIQAVLQMTFQKEKP